MWYIYTLTSKNTNLMGYGEKKNKKVCIPERNDDRNPRQSLVEDNINVLSMLPFEDILTVLTDM